MGSGLRLALLLNSSVNIEDLDSNRFDSREGVDIKDKLIPINLPYYLATEIPEHIPNSVRVVWSHTPVCVKPIFACNFKIAALVYL